MNYHDSEPDSQTGLPSVRIWDVPVRLFHWLLVLCIAVAAVTGFLLNVTWLQYHIVAGTAAGILVLARLVWGFTGTSYSRFSSYTLRPSQVFEHVKHIREGIIQRDAGHNPLGAWMVIGLMLVILLIVVSGFVVLGGQMKQGPLKAFLSFAEGSSLRDVHQLAAIGLLVMVGAHISGALFESWRSRENLPRAMVTGMKRPGFAHEARPIASKPIVALLGVSALAALIVPASAKLIALPPFGIHAIAPDATWKEECSSCHMAFPPSLLPAASWKGIMANLSDHFGEDASLDANKVNAITDFLVANAAETQDSLPANRLRRLDPARPLEITATPFWKRMHGEIPDAVFTQKSIGARQNCAACHGDAETTAMFAPQMISVPKEKKQ